MQTMAEALAWVNEARRARGLTSLAAFPPGIPCDPGGCPVSLALEANITFDGLVFPHEADLAVERLPEIVQRFANDFDVGIYPLLELATPVPVPA